MPNFVLPFVSTYFPICLTVFWNFVNIFIPLPFPALSLAYIFSTLPLNSASVRILCRSFQEVQPIWFLLHSFIEIQYWDKEGLAFAFEKHNLPEIYQHSFFPIFV